MKLVVFIKEYHYKAGTDWNTGSLRYETIRKGTCAELLKTEVIEGHINGHDDDSFGCVYYLKTKEKESRYFKINDQYQTYFRIVEQSEESAVKTLYSPNEDLDLDEALSEDADGVLNDLTKKE